MFAAHCTPSAVHGGGGGSGTTYLAYDTFNRADAAYALGGLGTTSGDSVSGTGGGLTWNGYGGISSNKATLSDGSFAHPAPVTVVNVGTSWVEVDADIVLGTSRNPQLWVGAISTGQYGVWYDLLDDVIRQISPFGSANLAIGSTNSAGTYHAKLRLDNTGTARVFLNGSPTAHLTASLNWALESGANYAGIGQSYVDGSIFFDNFAVIAAP